MKSNEQFVLVTIITVAVVVLFLSAFIAGLPREIEVNISPRIYSPDNNIGVLNEIAAFDITIRNLANSTTALNLVVDADQHVLLNDTIRVEPNSLKNLTISQQLVFLGAWKILLLESGKIIGGYSFVTVVNNAEADMQITQLDNIRFTRNLSIVAIIIAIPGAIIAAVNVYHSIRQRKSRRTKRELKQ